MNNFLFSRALGSISQHHLATEQHNRYIHSFQPANNVRLTYLSAGHSEDNHEAHSDDLKAVEVAHPAGVNSIVIDPFEGRYLLSGGADASIACWDLEAAQPDEEQVITHRPLGKVAKDSTTHGAGITHLSFYPFDSGAFTSSSYDHSLHVYSSETFTSAASFDLGSVVYSHALSPVATHLLVACATQHPAVRLVDLKSGASIHALAGHGGAVMSVAWHPTREHLLVSGATDGTVRLWDIRRSASSLGLLDADDSVGVDGLTSLKSEHRRSQRGKAHTAAVNGVLWTEDGDFIVTSGQDQTMRVWDGLTGANTLVNFGPTLRNSHNSSLLPLVSPSHLTGKGQEVIIYPNPRELLIFELHTGRILSKLRTPSYASSHTTVHAGSGTRNVLNRTTSLAWRAHDIEVYSAHTDGTIRCWRPRTWEDNVADAEGASGDDDEEDLGAAARERKRKREQLDELVNGLTKKQVTFS